MPGPAYLQASSGAVGLGRSASAGGFLTLILESKASPALPRVGLSTGLQKAMHQQRRDWGVCREHPRLVTLALRNSHPAGMLEPWGPRILL